MLARIAEGELVCASCAAEGLDRETLYRWRDASAANATAYARAREMGVDALAEDCIRLADDSAGDVYVDGQGRTRIDTECVARSRLRIDARKWLLATISPRRYGTQSNVDLTSGGEPLGAKLRAARERRARLPTSIAR